MKRILFLLWCAILILPALRGTAQTKMLQNFVRKLSLHQNISYTSIVKNDGFVGEFSDTIQTFQTLGSRLQFEMASKSEQDRFDGKKLLRVNLTGKYYSVVEDYTRSQHYFNSIPLFKIARLIHGIKQPAKQIILLADTIINTVSCYHIRVLDRDTLIRNKRSYTIYELYFNKTTDLPMYAESQMKGFLEKGGIASEDMIYLVNRNFYSNYKFSGQPDTDRTSIRIPAGFITEDENNNRPGDKPQPLLSAGSGAPGWKLEDLKGKILSSGDLKGKIIIMDFWGNCAACIMAVPTVSRLHKKYEGSDVVIVSVDVDEGKEPAVKFAEKYQLPYPVYFNGKALSKEFHVTPIPTFYIIDQQGKIVAAMEGFSNELERQIDAHVDRLRK